MTRLKVVACAALLWACDDSGAGVDNADADVLDAAVDGAPDALGDGALDAAPDLDEGAPDGGDAGDAAPDMADARIPSRAAERPTEGEADLPGATGLTDAVPPGAARAGVVARADERLTGPEAQCRVGHFRLDNARISVCVQAETSFSQVTTAGGNIIDAHRADRPGTDLFGEMYVAPGLGEVTVESIGVVRDGSEGGPAIVRTVGHLDGSRLILGYLTVAPAPVLVTTEYRLAPDADWIDVYTWIDADSGFARLLVAEFLLFGDRTRGFTAGAPVSGEAIQSTPFLAADGPQVSYAWSNLDQDLSLLQIPLSDFPLAPVNYGSKQLPAGDEILLRRRLTVGTGDVESVRPPPPAGVTVTFTGPAGALVSVDDGEALVTRVRLGEDGARAAVLAPGEYQARSVEWVGGDVTQAFTVAGEAEVALALPAPGTLTLRVTDAEGAPIAAKAELTGPGERRVLVNGATSARLPAGTWRMVTTRGWHFTADVREIEVVAGEPLALDVTLTEVIPFEGWTHGDFHQHASPSLDSTVAVEDRVLSNVVEGVGFMVPSDHDRIFDYAPLVAEMGLSDVIAAPLIGVEISPLVAHIGAYGIGQTPGEDAGGSPSLALFDEGRWRKRTMVELATAARDWGAEFVQINHPRASQGYFDLVGYNPTIDVDTLDSADWSPDFDTVEVFNERDLFCQVFADWLGLLNQGVRITAVGNSDTHSLGAAAGYPRNYLPTSADRPQDVTADEITAALRAGQVSVGGGAYLDLPDGPVFGALVEPAGGRVEARVRVRTPPFTRVHRVLAFFNGVAVYDQPLDGDPADVVDFDELVSVPVEADGHLVFLALGDLRARHVESQLVFALGNPIWVDADGDGAVTPAGAGAIQLPAMQVCE